MAIQQRIPNAGGLEKKIRNNGFMNNIVSFPLFLNGEKTIIDLPEGTNRHFIVRDGSWVKDGYSCFIEFYQGTAEQNGIPTYTGANTRIELYSTYRIPDKLSHLEFAGNIGSIKKYKK